MGAAGGEEEEEGESRGLRSRVGGGKRGKETTANRRFCNYPRAAASSAFIPKLQGSAAFLRVRSADVNCARLSLCVRMCVFAGLIAIISLSLLATFVGRERRNSLAFYAQTLCGLRVYVGCEGNIYIYIYMAFLLSV